MYHGCVKYLEANHQTSIILTNQLILRLKDAFLSPATLRKSKNISKASLTKLCLNGWDNVLPQFASWFQRQGKYDVVEKTTAQKGIRQVFFVVRGNNHNRAIFSFNGLACFINKKFHFIEFG